MCKFLLSNFKLTQYCERKACVRYVFFICNLGEKSHLKLKKNNTREEKDYLQRKTVQERESMNITVCGSVNHNTTGWSCCGRYDDDHSRTSCWYCCQCSPAH